MKSDDDLAALMRRYQEGDQDAFREIYVNTSPGIERYLRRWSDSARAGDLTQEVFLQVHRARRTYRAGLPLLPWMFAIARHVAIQHVRSQGRRLPEVQSDDSSIVAIAGSAEANLLARHDLGAAMQQLSDEHREALWLTDVEGFNSSEIARITGVSAGTIRVRIHRARQKLKNILNDAAAQS
ncbi:MAG TPA: RNA polymerase sigma factor [Thermoanaerobaculia bacterium]|nr:RNA polymerase sigma factor [Thermoanaerobaculia bacterium]